MECEHIKEYLVAYHQGKLTPEEEAVIEEHIQTCSTCKQESGYIKKKNQPKGGSKKKSSWILAGIIILLFSVAVFILSDGEGTSEPAIGRNLNISSVYNDVKITITDMIADDLQTIINYEIEDLSKETYYHLEFSGSINGYVDSEITAHRFNGGLYNNAHGNDLNRDDNYIYTGTLYAEPLRSEEGIFELEILEVYETLDSSIMEGKWEFEIPFIRQESIVKKLDKQIEVAGIPLTFTEIVIAPTTTVIKYNYSSPSLGDVQRLNFPSISSGDQVYKITRDVNMFLLSSRGYDYEMFFESMYDQDIPKQLDLELESFSVFVFDQTIFEINPELETQSFEYLGTTITIDQLKVGNRASLTVREEFDPNRAYERLQFEVNFEGPVTHELRGDTTLKIVDKHGEILDEEDAYYFFDQTEQIRYFSVDTDVIVENVNSEVITPKSLEIGGYNTTIIVDEIIELNLLE
ncbi:hypothetical protein J2T56_002002 [Natronobacillus azotifigens]|uniref:Zf-HC2 domain-containing protein n=1 Tax=Natronobacillus azotifigens TaxID=472978 RepID=A0A9J6REL6_9BACI|nr:zf-HC2 domain-containing protein [Natronobacillus azotifigens]MCZ0703787.1 zf-HC2 domain-containing protein [Natronobacillus azotifigens]